MAFPVKSSGANRERHLQYRRASVLQHGAQPRPFGHWTLRDKAAQCRFAGGVIFNLARG